MLLNAGGLFDFDVIALNGYCGKITDLYFDETEWFIRYIVVSIEEVLATRKALISPVAITHFDPDRKSISIDETKEKVINSPEIDIDLPLSRQYEAAIHRYFEWPVYWGQTSFLDTTGIKTPNYENRLSLDENIEPPTQQDENLRMITLDEGGEYDGSDEGMHTVSEDEVDGLGGEGEETVDEYEQQNGDEINDTFFTTLKDTEPVDEETTMLDFAFSEEDVTYSGNVRSVQEIMGYELVTNDEGTALLDDCIIETNGWEVKLFAVTINQHMGKSYSVLLPASYVKKISWQRSRALADVAYSTLIRGPRYTRGSQVESSLELEAYSYFKLQV